MNKYFLYPYFFRVPAFLRGRNACEHTKLVKNFLQRLDPFTYAPEEKQG